MTNLPPGVPENHPEFDAEDYTVNYELMQDMQNGDYLFLRNIPKGYLNDQIDAMKEDERYLFIQETTTFRDGYKHTSDLYSNF